MDVRCERCKTQYELDDSRVTEAGVTVRCTQCQHTFIVKKRALVVTVAVKPGEDAGAVLPLGGAEPIAAAPQPPAEKPREWRVRQANGNVFTCRESATLQRWIVERKVSRGDEVSTDGQNWARLGNIAELEGFFRLVDEAQRAAELELQARLGRGPGASEPPPPSHPGTPPPASEPPRGGARLLPWVLLALLAGVGAAAYLGVLRPREVELNEQLAARQADLQREQARVAELEARLQAIPTQVAETPDAGQAVVAAAEVDGGTGPDAGTEDAGNVGEMTPDAGATDGGASDAGAPDAGVPDAGAPRRPEPVRDFDGYMALGDRQRERERAEQAMDAYDKAAELAPERAEPYAGRGLVHLDLGDFALAETEFLRALQANPRYGVALMGLAETYRSQGKKAEAVRYYERYLEVLPDGPEAAVARSALERLRK
ncbi:zinc-ribbon domain-containing protein [Myxococcaceae bacterium GXIMD 01537]